MKQETIADIQKYETIIIPQEEIDKIVSPEDYVPKKVTRKKKRLLKKVVRYMHCPTCGVVIGHRRRKGTLNTYDCCVCGHDLPRIDTDLLVTGTWVLGILAAVVATAAIVGEPVSAAIAAEPFGVLPLAILVGFGGSMVWVMTGFGRMC